MRQKTVRFFIKKEIGRKWCSIYAALHLYFYYFIMQEVEQIYLTQQAMSKALFSLLAYFYQQDTMSLFRNMNTRKSCFCCSDLKQYNIQEGRSNVHFGSVRDLGFLISSKSQDVELTELFRGKNYKMFHPNFWRRRSCKKKCSQEVTQHFFSVNKYNLQFCHSVAIYMCTCSSVCLFFLSLSHLLCHSI